MAKYIVRKERVLVSLEEFMFHANRLSILPNIYDINGNYLGEIIDDNTYRECKTKELKPLDYENHFSYVNADITYK